jgi:hypothetical protein
MDGCESDATSRAVQNISVQTSSWPCTQSAAWSKRNPSLLGRVGVGEVVVCTVDGGVVLSTVDGVEAMLLDVEGGNAVIVSSSKS